MFSPLTLTHCQRSLRTFALLLACFVVLTPLAGSRIFVSAALERIEFYAGVIPPDPVVLPAVHKPLQAQHAVTPAARGHVSTLNLFFHLSGIFKPAMASDWLAGPSGGTLAASITALPEWALVFAIFEPPKTRALLP